MEIAINKCYGGFSLSPKAVARLAELQGRKCYFFKADMVYGREYIPSTLEECSKVAFWSAFDIPNPPRQPNSSKWSKLSNEQKERWNKKYRKHNFSCRNVDRCDPLLIQVIKELGKEANGFCAKIGIVEVPDGVNWEINEYDGMETIHESHRTWG